MSARLLDAAVLLARLTKGDVFRRFPLEGDATYDARQRRIRQEIAGDLARLNCEAFAEKYGPWLHGMIPVPFEAVSFDRGASFRAVVAGQLQRPDFNSRGAALAFAGAVARGARRPKPTAP